MEDSRKGGRSREKGLPPPNPHVDGGNGKKAMVYNTKREKKGGGRRKREKKRKKKRLGYSQVIVLGHFREYFLYRYMRITLSF